MKYFISSYYKHYREKELNFEIFEFVCAIIAAIGVVGLFVMFFVPLVNLLTTCLAVGFLAVVAISALLGFGAMVMKIDYKEIFSTPESESELVLLPGKKLIIQLIANKLFKQLRKVVSSDQSALPALRKSFVKITNIHPVLELKDVKKMHIVLSIIEKFIKSRKLQERKFGISALVQIFQENSYDNIGMTIQKIVKKAPEETAVNLLVELLTKEQQQPPQQPQQQQDEDEYLPKIEKPSAVSLIAKLLTGDHGTSRMRAVKALNEIRKTAAGSGAGIISALWQDHKAAYDKYMELLTPTREPSRQWSFLGKRKAERGQPLAAATRSYQPAAR